MTKRIETVTDLVEALGGTAAVARWLDVGMPAVSNWKASNDLPRGWHFRVWMECQRRELPVSGKLFGLKPSESIDGRSRPRRRRTGPLGSSAAA